MSISQADQLSKEGLLLQAEDLYWDEIEAGNTEARLRLAYAFHDAGLTSLALDHYLELQGTDYWVSAAPQASMIHLDVHQYDLARKMLEGLSHEQREGSDRAIESEEEKSAGYLIEIPDIVQGQLWREAELLEEIRVEPSGAKQAELVELRMYLAHYASVLSSKLGVSVASQDIEVGFNGVVVTRNLAEAIGSPSRRWFEAAHATANAFTLLSDQFPTEVTDFQALVSSCQNFIEKKYVISGRELSESDEDFVINNLTWALGKLNLPAKDFYTHLLPED